MSIEVLEVPEHKQPNFSGEIIDPQEAAVLINYAEPPELILVFCDQESQGTIMTFPIQPDEIRRLKEGSPQQKDEILSEVANYPTATIPISPGETRNPKIINEHGEPLTLCVRNLGDFTVVQSSN